MLSNRGDNQPKVQCPYNSSHFILKHRFQNHLIKCQRSANKDLMATCMYNVTHHVAEPSLASHHEVCPDRIQLDKFLFISDQIDETKYPIPKTPLAQPTENWDDDPPASYNPEEHAKNSAILRTSYTLSQAQRRHFRMEERQRMQHLLHSQENTVEEKYQPEQRPRRPTAASAGLKNRMDLPTDDISKLMEKVNEGSNFATTPKFKVNSAPTTSNVDNSDEFVKVVYKKRASNLNSKTTIAKRGAQEGTSTQTDHFSEPMNPFSTDVNHTRIPGGEWNKSKIISRGRGRGLNFH